MPAGLQVFNANGALRLEITDRLTRLVGTFTLPAWNDTAVRFVPVIGMSDDGFWVITLPCPDYYYQIVDGGINVWSTGVRFTGFTSIPITVYRV